MADDFELPLNVDDLSDQNLELLVNSPNETLAPFKSGYIKPTIITADTRIRLENILKDSGNTPDAIQRRIEQFEKIKVKNIDIWD